MTCHDFLSILDDHAWHRLTPARKSEFEGHAVCCVRCRLQWTACRAVETCDPPAMPAGLYARVRAAAASGTGRRTPRRTLPALPRPLVVGALLSAGAALAAGFGLIAARDTRLAAVAPAQLQREMPTKAEAAPPRPSARATSAATAAETAAAQTTTAGPPSREPTDPGQRLLADGESFALLKVPPRYPREAAERGLEGTVVVEFTVDADGNTTEIGIVESTDALFERAAIEAVEQFKYMPRVANGERVPVRGVRNRLVFRLEHPGASPADEREALQNMVGIADSTLRPEALEFLAPALDCVAQGDLGCAEQALDEAAAIYRLDSEQQRALAKFYGFIHARLGNTERAIAAYESAAAIPGAAGHDTTLLTVAHLYLQRQLYVQALDRVEAYIERAEADGRPIPSAYRFADRLRQLGAAQQ